MCWNRPWTSGEQLFLTMTNFGSHPAFLTSYFASPFSRSFCTHLVWSPIRFARTAFAPSIEAELILGPKRTKST
jgi:hypothetical protein